MTYAPPPPPWRDWTEGTRVMVRRHIDDAQHKYTDLLGVILSNSPDGLVLETRSGEQFVPGDTIFQGKPVPPPPPKRRPRVQPDDD